MAIGWGRKLILKRVLRFLKIIMKLESLMISLATCGLTLEVLMILIAYLAVLMETGYHLILISRHLIANLFQINQNPIHLLFLTTKIRHISTLQIHIFPAYSYGTDEEHHHVSIDKSTDTLMKSQKMTPKEKIEKLRKRHQIQALLGIRKQQQQLSSEDNKVLHFERDDLEGKENMDTICGPSSPLYQLQNAVNDLDMNIRLCIKDSLFRLAQSAAQRNCESDAMHANTNSDFEVSILEADISNQERFMEMPSAETETNCIDRAIAHLLFHQPLKSTSNQVYSKNLPGLEMSASNRMPLSFVAKSSVGEYKTACSMDESQPEDFPEQQQTDTSKNLKLKQKMVDSAV